MNSIELIPLFSGSSGNSTLVRAGGYSLLFDAGRNCKQIVTALNAVGTSPEEIRAVFVTHSHSDHIDALDVFIRKYPSPVYATEGTHKAFARKCKKPHPLAPDIIIEPGEEIRIDDNVRVISCATPHDARGSVCYKIVNGKDSCMIMTDLGHVTDEIRNMAMCVDGILIESNYDQKMLVYGPYPEDLKARVGGKNGHLSNDDCALMVRDLIDSGTRKFILGHLSENNNTREKAYDTVTGFLKEHGYEAGVDYEIEIANRYDPTKGIVIL
ncbi:MAG: MBL fold metallo-hydrolase [Clostridiales bacterium]|nr:MBL fold metallo-hydrolase [Clostridiales bacterium]HAW16370.1 MBL fold metallo-hydrolase [Clostridiales bacterium]